MKRLYTAAIAIFILILTIQGCKLDPPIYPDDAKPVETGGTGTGTGSGTGTGTGTGAGTGTGTGTVTPVKNGSTIVAKVDGVTTTYTFTIFQVVKPMTGLADGNTQITGSDGSTNTANFISFTFPGYQKGTFDINVAVMGTSFGSGGKAVVTDINVDSTGVKGTIKGTFEFEVSDLISGTTKKVTGTFNITQ